MVDSNLLVLAKEFATLKKDVKAVLTLPVGPQGPIGKEGPQGKDGKDGKSGKDGTNGKDGQNGKDGSRGLNGIDGRDGLDGKDGVSVADAKIDFDGSLVITLTNGQEINAGDVITENIADTVKVIKSGGGNSQFVLDTLDEVNALLSTYGTLVTQDADTVAISGGTINNTSIGASVPTTGTFTTLSTDVLTASGQASLGGPEGSESLRAVPVVGAVNWVQVQGGTAGGRPTLSAQGSDANIGLTVSSKGTGAFFFLSSSGAYRQFQIDSTTNAVNNITVTGSVAGVSPAFSSRGTDTNIDLILTPKGTGKVRFGTYTANMALVVQGYIEVKDSGGTIRKLAVIA